MKQVIPFSKDITFKSKVGELTSISLDHDLQLKGEDIVTGNFYIKGKYKLTSASQVEEEFSYKIPCDIAISDDYDAFDAKVDIDDFHYDIVNDEILRVDIAVSIENLVKKEKKEEIKEVRKEEIKINKQEDDIRINFTDDNNINPLEEIKNIKQELFNNMDEETYSTYLVYLVKEEDTVEKICEKYKVTKEDILLYNDLSTFSMGTKLVIPDVINNE